MKKRVLWLDVLRILSAFFVIVNHTNSDVFRSVTPQNGTWWFSILWYALSKVAVPVFIMVSGACLLGREDSWRKCMGRFARIVAVLLIGSVFYYVYDCSERGNLMRVTGMLTKMWERPMTNSFWYLYFYAGMMLMLPMFQRLSCAMHGKDLAYLTVMCIAFGSLAPLLEHINPVFAIMPYVDVPLFSTYIGLFFAGWWIRKSAVPSRGKQLFCVLTIALCLLASLYLLRLGYAPDKKYWLFMDNCMHPGFLIVIAAMALAVLCKGLFSDLKSQRMARFLTSCGGCAFGIYLLNDWLIAETELSIFLPLCNILPAFPAVVVWEVLIFLAALLITWLVRLIPGMKKLI